MVVGVAECLAIYAGTRMVGIRGVRQNAIRKAHFEVVIPVVERQQVVVQEVKRRNPEFDILTFGDLEALEQREIAVPEHRPRHVRNASVADLAGSGQREAVRVDELVLLQALGRVAVNVGVEVDIWRSQQSNVPGRSGEAKIQARVSTIAPSASTRRRDLCPALNLRDAGDLPSIRYTAQKRIA